ncbi:MAG: aminotransferase class I/II-fold pyridoxal phosphate-dependent enzyme [Gemmatimonadota bacterium]
MSRVARETGAVNLAQGFPDFPAPSAMKDAARRAIAEDVNQYAVTWGADRLRRAISRWYGERYAMDVDPDKEVTVTCGATEAMASVFLGLLDPGDEVIVLEPYYENYAPDALLAGATARFLALDPPHYRFDPERLERAIGPRTRALVINTPNNPTGRVFDGKELGEVARICRERDLVAITDEIYECIVYDGDHVPLATLPGMRERTITVSGASKTFAVTGWRLGSVVAPPSLSEAIRKVHDFLTVGAPAPLQEAWAFAIEEFGVGYFDGLMEEYRARRDFLVDGLRSAGFECRPPEGAYYILADFSSLSELDDTAFSLELSRSAGVTPVPGSSFFNGDAGRSLVRFAFCKRQETLDEGVSRLVEFSRAGGD